MPALFCFQQVKIYLMFTARDVGLQALYANRERFMIPLINLQFRVSSQLIRLDRGAGPIKEFKTNSFLHSE
ncbi:hypothetical protein NC653_039670 [Populus alba x Populus x berolinensis]|uniref:Uncharacterized protein n=1 Tax=Populus alba x Populus x berolinensis TaxID=444605 RepID=A0AAD6PRM4_9ROSI|nr:hypothetical protein NC653_039670 [Populus alba x Populus x berolinensis]